MRAGNSKILVIQATTAKAARHDGYNARVHSRVRRIVVFTLGEHVAAHEAAKFPQKRWMKDDCKAMKMLQTTHNAIVLVFNKIAWRILS